MKLEYMYKYVNEFKEDKKLINEFKDDTNKQLNETRKWGNI
jgi:hypothetical protein